MGVQLLVLLCFSALVATVYSVKETVPTIKLIGAWTLKHLSPHEEHVLHVDVDSPHSMVTSAGWNTTNKLSKEDTELFWKSAVTTNGSYQIVFPANKSWPNGPIDLVFHAKNSAGEKFKTVSIKFKPEGEVIKLKVEPPTGHGITNNFTFTIEKASDTKLDYNLSYTTPSGQHYLIASGKDTAHIDPISYRFEVPRQEKETFNVVLSYHDLKDHEQNEVLQKVEVTQPDKAVTLKSLESLINFEMTRIDRGIDLNLVQATTHSIMNIVFRDEGIHLTSHGAECNSSYCSLYGKCIEVGSHWRKCDCIGNFKGPTCAFKDQNEMDQVLGLVHNITRILREVKINEQNVTQVLTIMRLLTSNRHYFSHEIIETTQFFVTNLLHRMVKMDITIEDVTEIFKIAENIQASLNRHHFARDSDYSILETDKLIMKNHQIMMSIFSLYAREFAEIDTGDANFGFSLRETNLNTSGVPFARIVASLEAGKEELETVLIFFPRVINSMADWARNKKKKIRFYEYLSRVNQYEVLMDDVYDVVAPVAQFGWFAFVGDNNITDAMPYGFTNNSLHIMFPREIEDKDEQCAWWDNEFNYWETRGCITISGQQAGMEEHYLDGQQMIQCQCFKGKIFTIVKPNPSAKTTLDDRATRSKPDIAVVIIILMSSMIIIQCIVMRKEGNPNNAVLDDYTTHPVYSIMFVTSGTLERKMRVQLLFLSFIMQLLAELYFLEKNYSITSLAIHGIILSIPCNYAFGVLANIMTSLEKIKGKTLFMLLTTIGAAVLLTAADIFWVRPEMRPEVFTTIVSAFLLGIAIDLGVLDILVTYLCTLSPQLRNLVRFRGFEHETPIPGSKTEKKRFIIENL